MNEESIRNFCIVAHIDHGKSTLADRLIEATGALTAREMREQVLDSMDIERERGITIKAQTVSMLYLHKDNKTYQLNLIDTPGHVDFSYEVSRSLAACEGALIVVDASQGVEAQTVANVQLAMKNNLTLVPVINKIDLPSAEPDRVKEEIEEELAIETDQAVLVSAKSGLGIQELLTAIVEQIPPPKKTTQLPLQALIFDSWFDSYMGVVSMIRLMAGSIQIGDKIRMMSTQKSFDVLKLGKFTPKQQGVSKLSAGEVGFLAGTIKEIADMRVGDTVTSVKNPTKKILKGFMTAKPMVFGGVFPIDTNTYQSLKESLEKLKLNDAALSTEVESSNALGMGFRVGFLGLLHMDIVQERLEREYNLGLIFTAPSVIYHICTVKGQKLLIENPSVLPPVNEIDYIKEPFVLINIYTPKEYIGNILQLVTERRGIQRDLEYTASKRVRIIYELPMNEMIFDFHDQIKSLSRGYASMEYELLDYRKGDLVKLDILVNGEPVDALSTIIHRSQATYKGRALCKSLKKSLHRQMFSIAVQAAIGGKILARETVSAMRKDVTAKCYGGDITRKRKLLEKQKEGKKRMKQIGRVEISQEAFLSVLRINES